MSASLHAVHTRVGKSFHGADNIGLPGPIPSRDWLRAMGDFFEDEVHVESLPFFVNVQFRPVFFSLAFAAMKAVDYPFQGFKGSRQEVEVVGEILDRGVDLVGNAG